jgi:hypothetical protein
MPMRRSGVGTLGYSGDKVLSVRPYSPPPGGSAPDLKFRRCFGNDSCQLSMQPEREVDPPSSIRHQSHLMPFVEIMPKRQQHTTQCRQAPASRLRTSARVPSADAVRGSRSQLIVLFQDRAFECSTFSETELPRRSQVLMFGDLEHPVNSTLSDGCFPNNKCERMSGIRRRSRMSISANDSADAKLSGDIVRRARGGSERISRRNRSQLQTTRSSLSSGSQCRRRRSNAALPEAVGSI